MPVNAVQGVISRQAGVESSTWVDRLQPAVYESPSGRRVEFAYEDVQRIIPLRTTAFEFPGVDNAYVQQNGYGARQYPVRAHFWGPYHDVLATAYEAALIEAGAGKLEHPLYGTLSPVVPFGEIARRNDLVRQANQSVVDVVFWTTTGAVYPTTGISPRNEIDAALDAHGDAMVAAFDEAVTVTSTIQKGNIKATILDFLQSAESTIGSLSDATSAVNRDFQLAARTINRGIDVLVGQPLLLARQIVNLTTAPGRALVGVRERLRGYADFADSIYESAAASGTSAVPGATQPIQSAAQQLQESNNFHAADLFIGGSVSGSALAALETTYLTRTGAVQAAASVLAQFDDASAWRDGRFDDLDQIDGGASYQALYRVVTLLAGYLVDTSFTLAPERSLVLDRARTIVDLCAQLYGDVSNDRLDFLITSNGLNGNEILELPKGKRVVYYA